jgi:pimeloyl-ACP methyl ester carboxylesterase
MPFVTAGDGTELYYESEGDGFPLVFTHGNMGFGQQFFLQTRAFQRRYRCLLHDSRGCGLSGKPTYEIYDAKTQAARQYESRYDGCSLIRLRQQAVRTGRRRMIRSHDGSPKRTP